MKALSCQHQAQAQSFVSTSVQLCFVHIFLRTGKLHTCYRDGTFSMEGTKMLAQSQAGAAEQTNCHRIDAGLISKMREGVDRLCWVSVSTVEISCSTSIFRKTLLLGDSKTTPQEPDRPVVMEDMECGSRTRL